MTSLAETFAQVRVGLEENGMVKPDISLFQGDQMRAAFRADLLSLGLDVGREGSIEAALAGMAIGMKVLVQFDMPLPYINHYVGICECLLPMLEETGVDLSSFEDNPFPTWAEAYPTPEPVIRYACSKCGASNAVVPVGAFHLCVQCASEAVTGGLAALRLAGSGMPKVGGPEFDQSAHTEDPSLQAQSTGHAEAPSIGGAEPAGGTVDTPPPPSWKNVTVAEAAGAMRRFWRRKK